MYESFTDRIDLLSVSFNWDESPAICTWHWCRGLSPSWHIQHLKSSPYTGPSWWPPTTHPLCSHWTLGWTGPPCWDTEHTHNSMTFCRVEWLKNNFLTAAEVNYLSFAQLLNLAAHFKSRLMLIHGAWSAFWKERLYTAAWRTQIQYEKKT